MCENENKIEFRDLSYSVDRGVFKKTSKQVLKNISGEFKSCELTAVVGPSGSGKSSLLNILSGYIAKNISGSIEVNETCKRSYIMQEENLHKLLTVMESMTFSINLKTGSRLSPIEKKRKVIEILENLGLDNKIDAYAGDLSGGQLKRLAIALELVDDPSVIFLDEPTTGLDSSSSNQCIQLLKKLAQQRKTIVCTIHTPSALLFEMFDHLYALADGSCIYQGSVRSLIPFLSEIGLACPESYNPSDFLMEIANGDYGEQNQKLTEKISNGTNEKYRKQSSAKTISDWDFQMPSVTSSSPQFSSSFLTQLRLLIWRNFLILYRDKTNMWLRLGIHIVVPLLVGSVFRNVGGEASKIFSNFKLIYAMNLFLMYTGFYSLVTKFALDAPTIKREHFNRWYSTSAYYIAVTLTDIPLTAACSSLFVTILYLMSGQPPEEFRFVMFWSAQTFLHFVSQGFGMMIGSLFQLMGSLFFASMSLPIIILFGGFMVTQKDANFLLRWVFDICFVKYSGDASMAAILGYNRTKLKCEEQFYCHFQRPDKFLETIGVDDEISYETVAILMMFLVVFRAVAFYMINYRLKH